MLGVLNFLNKPLTIRWYLLNPSITTLSAACKFFRISCQTNSPYQFHKKCTENSKENMHFHITAQRVKKT